MRILVALGGNALLRRGEPADADAQRRNVEAAAEGLAAIAAENELVVLGAESEGTVGQMLGLALRNAMPDRDVVTVLTEVVVSPDDPAFRKPSKPIGVPSPEPNAVVELRSLRVLIESGALLMLTDVDAIQLDWWTDRARPLRAASPSQLRALDFAAGSIGPKVEAACRFVEATGRRAAVGALADAERIVRGEAGTQVGTRVGEPASA